jgi:hypothetical protein
MILCQATWIKLFEEKMMMTKSNIPLTENEKQNKPMPGEVEPNKAAVKAREFAAREKARLKNK